jgi:hypothetical protein
MVVFLCNAPYLGLRKLEHCCLLILVIQILTFVCAQLDWDIYLRYAHLDLIMCCMILFSLLYAYDDASSLVCLNMQIKMWNLCTWIPVQSYVVNAL